MNWSPCGNYLVSGSDDTYCVVWDMREGGDLSTSFPTGHTANIFCTRFMPESDNKRIITCAGNGNSLAISRSRRFRGTRLCFSRGKACYHACFYKSLQQSEEVSVFRCEFLPQVGPSSSHSSPVQLLRGRDCETLWFEGESSQRR